MFSFSLKMHHARVTSDCEAIAIILRKNRALLLRRHNYRACKHTTNDAEAHQAHDIKQEPVKTRDRAKWLMRLINVIKGQDSDMPSLHQAFAMRD
jgi:hypothetical protein